MTIWYPGCDNTTQNFQDAMNRPLNNDNHIVILHTTETKRGTWPGYGNGANAPNITVQGDTQYARGHFPVDVAACALKDPDSTAVRENREGVQIEIVATCDERNRSNPEYLFVGDLSDAFYEWLAEFVSWYKSHFGVFEIASSVTWKAYDSGQVGGSYGLNNGVRLSSDEFDFYNGILGHQHVPGNDHGDPGVIDVDKLISMAGGIVIPPQPPQPPDPLPKPPSGADIDLNGDVWVGLLKYGTQDSDSVRRMQKVLNGISLPPPGNVTIDLKPGIYGPQTDDVVRTWQLSIGNKPDQKGASSVGPLQASTLFKGTPCNLRQGTPDDKGTNVGGGTVVAQAGDVWVGLLKDGTTNSDSVSRMQMALNSTSFPPHKNIPVSGNFDNITADMVRNYQRHIGDAPDAPGKTSLGPKQSAKLFAGKGVTLHQGVPAGATAGGPKPPPTSAGVTTPFNGARITTPYGKRGSWAAGFHTGDDFATGTGTPIRTTWTGTVVGVYRSGGWGSAYGIHVIVERGGGVRQAFCHLSSVSVSVGQRVSSGQNIGKSGNTGRTTGPHLHLEERVAPYKYGTNCRKPSY